VVNPVRNEISNGVKDNLSQCRTAITDITERKKAEEERLEALSQFQAVVESVGEGITFSDNSGKFYVYNLRMQEITGFTQEEANNSGDFTRLLYPQPQERQKALERLQQIVEHKVALPYEVETTIQAKDGTQKVLWVSTRAMRFQDQEMFLSIYRDITQRKLQEEEVKRLLQVKTQFTSMVSHELRTPLAAIKEGIGIVLDGLVGEVSSEQKRLLGTAKTNVDRLARLINEILDFQALVSGKVEYKLQETDINEAVQRVYEVMNSLAKEKNLDFLLRLEENLPKIRIDRDKIIQVLTNLVNNALKFTEKGGITITTGRGDNFIQVSVKDTGLGIKKEDFPKLFQQFAQLERRTGGSGLGLAICKEIIEAQRGKIWVESEFGKGSTFHFVLPIVERRAL
jgi:PAS domain S-box-containing protein